MKLVDLDRCYSVSRVPLENGRELVLYNFHLSAYTSDGTIAEEQLEMLLSADILRLPIPFTRRELTDAVEFLLDGYRRTEPSLRPRRGPEEKALVEAAKGLLMARKGLTEEEAHRALQQRSMESGLRMETLARQLTQQTK